MRVGGFWHYFDRQSKTISLEAQAFKTAAPAGCGIYLSDSFWAFSLWKWDTMLKYSSHMHIIASISFRCHVMQILVFCSLFFALSIIERWGKVNNDKTFTFTVLSKQSHNKVRCGLSNASKKKKKDDLNDLRCLNQITCKTFHLSFH